MGGINDRNTTDELDNAVVTLNGATDDTRVGNIGDRLKVDSYVSLVLPGAARDFYHEVAEGHITGYSLVHKFGANFDVGTAAREDVWGYGGKYPWPTSALQTTIVSTSTADVNATGIGAWTVEVQGLDSNWDQLTVTANLNGTTPVVLGANFLRVFRVKVITAGSTHYNNGDIHVKHSTSVIGQINETENQSLMAVYTIPRDHHGYLYSIHAEVSGAIGTSTGKSCLVRVQRRDNAIANTVFQTKDLRIINEAGSQFKELYVSPELIYEKTDIVLEAEVGANSSIITAGFEILLEDESIGEAIQGH